MSGLTYTKAAIQIVFFYTVLFTALAIYDEKPCPELARDMDMAPQEVIEPGNAWIVFLGMKAPAGASPYEYGEEIMLELREALSAGGDLEKILEEYSADDTGLSFEGKIPKYDRYNYCGVTSYVAEHRDKIKDLIKNNTELITRYRSLHSYPRYNEAVDYGMCGPIPWFLPIKRCAQAEIWRLAMESNSGAMEAALSGAEKEIEFWRFIASNADTLLSKMVAIAILRMHMRFAADLAVCHDLTQTESQKVIRLLRPFEKGEDSLINALTGERRYIRSSADCVYGTLRNDSWRPISMLYKPNASGNRVYESLRDSFELARMSAADFYTKRKEIDEAADGAIGLPFLYNPMGEIITQQAYQFGKYMQSYIAVGPQMEAGRRLLLLRVYAKMQNITVEQAPVFLENNKNELGNPFTNGPMQWDPEGYFYYEYDGMRYGKVKAPVK